jgi:hypothetical protein
MQGQLCFRFLAMLLAACCATASADVITDWNDVALQKIRDARTSPPQASRHLAMLHTAMYDAVNGIKAPHQTRHQPYLHRHPGPPLADETAAASAAARQVLNSVWPGDPRFDAAYAAIVGGLPQDRATGLGIGYGEKVAAAILAARAQDGSADTSTYEQDPVPGIWRPTVSFGGVVRPALLPWWGEVEPFGIPAASLYLPPAPLALDSSLYAAEVNEVKLLGVKTGSLRTAEETEIALFWSNGAGTATPPGHWNVITQIISDSFGLTVDESARLFALLNVALADAAIVAWDCKYSYNLWRPITAIQEADSAGNDAVTQDPAWEPLLFTPPFPEYISGHSTFSAAAAAVLSHYFGTDELPFTSSSEEFPDLVRSYTSVWDAAEESGMSRIYGGIHFMSGNLYGLAEGAAIGDYVAQHLLGRHK